MSKNTINKVAVIGAGVMGAGIAAQVANAGIEVVLLDIIPKGADDRNVIAAGALARLKKSKPAAFMSPKNAKLVTVGNIEDNIKLLKECDWVIEAVIENLGIKQDLYKKIEKNRKAGAIVSSNTSTIPLDDLVEGFSKTFKDNFMITHFFNPPRYMRLLELVVGKSTKKASVDKIRKFADYKLGKSVVDCNDSPGFIANRIGTYWLHAAVTKAIKHEVDVESADAVMSRPIGVPKTGVFGLLDLVGIDLMPHIFSSFEQALKEDDAFHDLGKAPKLMGKMIKEGYTGRKGKGGFYRLDKNKNKEVIDLATGEYAKASRPKPAATLSSRKGGLRALVNHDSKEGLYALDVLANTLAYAASLVPEIADNINLIDKAMRLGYNWKYGPFELIDKIGVNEFAEMLISLGIPVPAIVSTARGKSFYRVTNGRLQYMDLSGEYRDVPREEGVILLQDIKRRSKPVFKNKSASVWDIGDGVLCLEFTSKMNSLNPFIISMINKLVDQIPKAGYKGLVIHNEGTNFSVGANIAMLLVGGKLRFWPGIRMILKHGQMAFDRMQKAPFPVVGAPSGMALGGGCEVLLHCDAVTPHAETYIGLVEAGVGIVPGWGGCKELMRRYASDKKTHGGPMPFAMRAFEAIAMAKVATSAHEAKELCFFNKDDEVVMNRDRLLADAKAKVLAMAPKYEPREDFVFKVAGASGKTAMKMGIADFVKKGIATPHDGTIATHLADVLTGGKADVVDEVSEMDILQLERDAIVRLCKTQQTRDRVEHMLKKGRPLRN